MLTIVNIFFHIFIVSRTNRSDLTSYFHILKDSKLVEKHWEYLYNKLSREINYLKPSSNHLDEHL